MSTEPNLHNILFFYCVFIWLSIWVLFKTYLFWWNRQQIGERLDEMTLALFDVVVYWPGASANKERKQTKFFFFDVSKMRAMSDIEFERFMKICVSFFSCVYSSLIPGHKRRSIQAESIQSWAHSCGCASMDLYFMNSARGSISSMYNIVICWALCRQAEWHFED